MGFAFDRVYCTGFVIGMKFFLYFTTQSVFLGLRMMSMWNFFVVLDIFSDRHLLYRMHIFANDCWSLSSFFFSLVRLLRDHSGKLQALNAFCSMLISASLSASLDTNANLFIKVKTISTLWLRWWLDQKFRYWFVWVFLQKIRVDMLPSASTSTTVSRNGNSKFCSCSIVDFILGCSSFKWF